MQFKTNKVYYTIHLETNGTLHNNFSNGHDQGVLTITTNIVEIIHGDIPGHGSTQSLLTKIHALFLDSFDIVIAHPLLRIRISVSIRTDGFSKIGNLRPGTSLDSLADFIVAKGAFFVPGDLSAISWPIGWARRSYIIRCKLPASTVSG